MKFSYFQRSRNNWTRSIMSDRATFSTQKCNFVQTRTYRSNSFGPSPQLGSHRSRRTLSLPAREKPIIPPVIAENPDSSQPIGEQYTMEEKFTKLPSKELEQPRPGYYRYEIGEQQLSLVKMIILWTLLSLGHHSCYHNKIFSSKICLRQKDTDSLTWITGLISGGSIGSWLRILSELLNINEKKQGWWNTYYLFIIQLYYLLYIFYRYHIYYYLLYVLFYYLK